MHGLKLYMVNTRSQQCEEYSSEQRLTSVAIHPQHYRVVTGNQRGEIMCWYDLPKGRFSLWHWHSHAVHTLNYSLDGNFVLSGGEENVLVIWNEATGKRSFVPRLNACLEHIVPSPQGDSYLLLGADNSLRQYNVVKMN